MAEDVGNLAVKISMDSTGFQNGISAINQQLKVVQSEFKAASAQLGSFGNSTDQLRLKSDSLNKQIDLQKQKVEALEKAYQTSVEKTGENSKASQDLAIKLNNAKAALANMENELQQTNKQLDESTKKQSLFGQMADKLHLNLEGLKTAFGAVGLAAGSFLKDAIEEASEAENANKNLEQTLKSTGDASGMTMESLEGLANSLKKTTTFSDDQIKAGEAMLLTFTNIGKNVFPQATQALLDLSQKMGSDPKEAAIQLGKALNDPVNGLTALRRVGVSFTAQQQEQIKTMVKAGDVAGAQKVILAELNKEFGGQAAAAAQTYDGRLKQMQNSFKEIKETIGTALLPVLTQLAGSLAKILQPIADFIEKNPQFTAAVLSIVAVLGTLIGGLSVINTLAGVFAPLEAALTGMEVEATSLIIPIIGVVAAIAAVAAAAYLIYSNWGTISTFFKNLWNEISTTVTNTWNNIKTFLTNTWNGITTTATNIWGGIGTFFTDLWNGIRDFFVNTWNSIVNSITNIINGFVNFIQTKFGVEIFLLQTAWTNFQTILIDIWNVIKTVVLGVVLLICDLITGDFTKLKEDTVKIFDSVREYFNEIWNAIQQIFTSELLAIELFITGVWNDIINGAKTAWESFKETVTNLWNTIVQGAEDIWNGLINWFKELPSALYNIATDMFDSMKNGVTNTVGSVKTAIVNGISSAIDWIKSLPSEAMEWGKDMINGFINGIKSMISSITNTVKNVANTIRSYLHFSAPDEGPLADYESWMPDFMAGLAKGIEDNKKRVQQAIQGLSADMKVGITSSTTASTVNVASTDGKPVNMTLIIELDSRTLIQKTIENMPRYLRVKGAVR
ncbi:MULTISPECIES: phage tail tape measure protein [Thermoanaerobacterium]|uniref:Phage tail tape measure protein, TP901 family n=2 Tax=Thermoanaerobacterium TaxID=28895 RepID=W9EA34_9THEO|nr:MULTISPECIES: phage tail tape measure protein [Thermoanaerobacterium]AFK87414.1 phage tail tape measure protein, TP901 family [Thermoanaerobacterium saccharolyticum JW/SL-YS485]ETO37785.1 phage tail tape measure protein, TP901 family [Thermoanaerobacterium aotearoense SCUT27]